MNIRQLQAQFRTAVALNKAGDIETAAQLFDFVERGASRSRSRAARALRLDAHCFCATALLRAQKAGLSQPELSRIGLIAAASKFRQQQVSA
jgi:hypothetical protein